MRVISVGYAANSAGVASWVSAMAGAVATLSGCGSRTGFDPLVEESRSDAALVAQDATPSTHTVEDAAPLDAASHTPTACRPPTGLPFPMFDDQCLTMTDCAVGLHGCCNQLAIGVRASQLSAFNTAESMWTSVGCATVDCALAVHHCSQEGVLCTAGTTVACVSGRCRSECL